VRLAVAAVLLCAGLLTPLPAGATGQGAVSVAGCVMTLGASFSPPLAATPAGGSMTISGSGTCVVNEHVLNPISLAGQLFTLAGGALGMGCASGTESGLVDMYGSFFPGEVGVTLTLENVAGTWTALFSKTNTTILVGVGTFEQGAAATLACPTGRVGGTTLTGAAVLFDPVVPQP
jgi:hypothetical protein